MSRGKIIEQYEHPRLRLKVPIKFHSEEGFFSAEFNKQDVTHADIKVVRQWLFTAINNGADLKWVPVIIVTFGDRWYSGGGDQPAVKLGYEREWFAQKVDGKWLKADWDTKVYDDDKERNFGEPADRLINAKSFILSEYVKGQRIDVKFSIPFKDSDDTGSERSPTLYLPYTEELWRTLESLTEAIRGLHKRLIEYMSDDQKRQQLVAGATQLLLPPAPPKGKLVKAKK